MNERRRNALLLALVAAIALVGGIAFALFDRAPPRNADALLALSLPDPSGTAQPLAQWRGKVLVVNFWATWCDPCREEMPEFVQAQSELGARGLQFVGIAVDQPEKVRRFASELKLNYPALIAGYDTVELTRPLGNDLAALPFTVIIDRQGRLVRAKMGRLKPDELRSIVGQLL